MTEFKPNFTTQCFCGGIKQPGATFCDPCWDSLPPRLQSEINVRISDYLSTAERSTEFLTQLALQREDR